MSHPGFEELRADVLMLAGEIEDAAPPTSLRKLLNEIPRDLAAPFYVVACGEFSRGKSSLLNAIVERPALFPTDIAVTTSVVSELRWAEQETATVVDGEGEAAERRVPLDRIADYVTEQHNPGNDKSVRTVRITAPVEPLRHGLALVDTPGIGSLNIEHSTATYAFLAKADAVLFVAAADERMSTTELDYLAVAMERCPTVITVITKIDKLVDPGPELANARERIATRTGLAPDKVLVLGVSARRKFTALARRDDALLGRSGFPELEELLRRRLAATLGAARLRSALDLLDTALRTQAVPVANALTALSSDGTLQEVRQQLERQRAQAERLASRTAAWRQELGTAFGSGVQAARAELLAECAELERNLQSLAHDDEVLDEPHLLIQEAATELVDIERRAGERLGAAAERAATTMTAENGMAMSPYAWSPQDPSGVELDLPEEIFDVRAGGGRWLTSLASAAQGATVGSSLGAGAGALLGTLLAVTVAPWIAPATALLGQLTGWIIGLRGHAGQVKNEQRERRLEILNATVLPEIHAQVERIQASVDEAAVRIRDALIDEFDGCVATARESLEESIASLEELRTSTERVRDRRHAELRDRRRRIGDLQDQLGALRRRVARMAGESGIHGVES